MGLTMTGIVNSVRQIVADDQSYQFCAIDIVSSRGARLACQVWPGVPQYQQVFDAGDQLINHKIKFSVLNYSTSEYETKQGDKRKQLRLRISNIHDLGIPQGEDELTGIVTNARAVMDFGFLAIDIVTSRGTTYACQVWESDYNEYAKWGEVEKLVNHKVKVTVVDATVGNRKQKDGSVALQARFKITNIRDLGFATEEDE